MAKQEDLADKTSGDLNCRLDTPDGAVIINVNPIQSKTNLNSKGNSASKVVSNIGNDLVGSITKPPEVPLTQIDM